MSQFQIAETSKRTKGDKDTEVQYESAPQKQYEVKPSEILIQCLHRPQEMIHPHIIDASYTWVDQGCGWQRIADPFGGWVHISRNWQSHVFLNRKEFKYLLMIDADESVPWWVPFHMAEKMDKEDIGVLSGVVCGFTAERGLFACVAVTGADGKARFPSIKDVKSLPAEGLQKVHNAGTGCLMIRRDVIEKLWLKYNKNKSFGQPFSIPENEQDIAAVQGALPRGEDVCFTDRCRSIGVDVYVDWAVKLGHQKPFLLAWPDQAVVRVDPDKWAKMAWSGVTAKEAKPPNRSKARRKRARKGS